MGMTVAPADAVTAYCRQKGYPEPDYEVRFHPGRKFAFDVAWMDYMVAMEFQGGIWTNGRHTRGKGYIRDCVKLNEASILGWRVLYVPVQWFKSGDVFILIDRVFETWLPFTSTTAGGKLTGPTPRTRGRM